MTNTAAARVIYVTGSQVKVGDRIAALGNPFVVEVIGPEYVDPNGLRCAAAVATDGRGMTLHLDHAVQVYA